MCTITPNPTNKPNPIVGKDLYTVVPDPKNYPKRELFRMWIVMEQMFDLDDSVLFPKVLMQNALFGWKDNNVEGVIVSAKQVCINQSMSNGPTMV